MSSLADQSRLSAEPLTFANRTSTKIITTLVVLFFAPLAAWFGASLILNPDERISSSRRGALFEGHGAMTQVWGVLFILLAIGIVLAIVPVFLSRVILTRQGIHIVKTTGITDLPWPPSRSAIVVTDEPGTKGTRTFRVWLIAADGKAFPVPDTGRSAPASKAARVAESLRACLADADTIWEWARTRGLVQDNGQYVATTNREVEANRLSAATEQALRGL
ncbi:MULTISPECIES: hypothetical protein [Actinomyces]|uniref:PH domain-containing protein n=1 Tax=Actinomyces respiraculi TaxID=2744574 RepID=A0A7T0LL18_9ACTO|nr:MULTISPECIES: hypothetical protein [Actinomyces]QPL05293.1 hypothetical protein ID810_11355 [Actinomyces respiraculi]